MVIMNMTTKKTEGRVQHMKENRSVRKQTGQVPLEEEKYIQRELRPPEKGMNRRKITLREDQEASQDTEGKSKNNTLNNN